jgi:histidinol-phosphate phosphatase family protein
MALRMQAAGFALGYGTRHVEHPVRPAGRWISVRLQAGNADDATMRALYGPQWRARAEVPAGRRRWHVATTAAGAGALLAALAGRRRPAGVLAAAWAALTADFAWRRIAPGPKSGTEISTMLATSAAIPPAACWHWLRGTVRARRTPLRTHPAPARPAALLVDRDGTLVHDVAYNGNPDLVTQIDGVKNALDRVRSLGIPVAVVTNQSGIARGLVTRSAVDAVNARVEELLGPFAGFFICPHERADGCSCRKPQPELLLKAAAEIGVDPGDCVMIGDIGADVDAALAAGMRAFCVPTAATRADEIAAAPAVFVDFSSAVDAMLGAVR